MRELLFTFYCTLMAGCGYPVKEKTIDEMYSECRYIGKYLCSEELEYFVYDDCLEAHFEMCEDAYIKEDEK